MPAPLRRLLARPLPGLALAVLLFLPATPAVRAVTQVRAQRHNTPPSASGALPPYPANHMLDGAVQPAGTPPANNTFTAAPYTVGTPPANSDFSQPPTPAGTPPQNNTFATGDFTGWTTTGAPTIGTDGTHPHYAAIPSGSSITSAPFTVDPAAQVVSIDVGHFSPQAIDWVQIFVLSGSGYTASTQIADEYCGGCGWKTETYDLSPYRGESIELQFTRLYGAPEITNVIPEVLFPGYNLSGSIARGSDSGGAYALLAGGGITSPAFALDPSAQSIALTVNGFSNNNNAQYQVKIHSGVNLATITSLGFAGADSTQGWQTARFPVGAYAGQTIQVEVDEQNSTVGLRAIGPTWVDVPSWSATGVVSETAGGPTGQAVSIHGGGSITSSPFTIAAGEQQLSLGFYGNGGQGTAWIDLLSGPNLATATQVGQVTGDPAQWKALLIGVQGYAGQTVALRIRQFNYASLYDDAGAGQAVLPGWTLQGTGAAQVGSDGHGSYVVQDPASGGPLTLQSSTIQTNMVLPIAGGGVQYIAVCYALPASSGGSIEVDWTDAATGQDWVLLHNVTNNAVPYATAYVPVYSFMGATGYLTISGAKFYSVGDNTAREALAEPFSKKVGAIVDTSTGTFGYQEHDLALGGPQPLVLDRYYNGQSDQFGALGYRWTTGFDTHLVVGGSGAAVAFGSGAEELFNLQSGVFSPADARAHDTLAQNGDGSYTFTTVSGLAYRFSATGVLQTVTDRNGNATTFAYNGTSGLLQTVTDPGGRTLTFAYNSNGQLTSVTEPSGGAESYSYSAAGDLATATDPNGGVRTYSYTNHLLTSVVDQNGKTAMANSFDGLGRLLTQTDATGKTTTLAYDAPSAGVTQVTDPAGKLWTYYYDTHQRTTDLVDPLGNVQTTIYDSAGNAAKVVDPASDAYTATYDASGMVTGTTDPLNQSIAIAYNPQHLPTTATDAGGNTTTYIYDSVGNMLQQTAPLGRVSTWTWDSHGNMLSAADPLGHTTSYTYDANNNRISKTDSLGNTWHYLPDPDGNILQVTDPLGNVTQTLYDHAGGRPIKQTDPLQRIST